jgi:hypothetical protein
VLDLPLPWLSHWCQSTSGTRPDARFPGQIGRLVIEGSLASLIVALLAFSLWHGASTLGVRLAAAFFGTTAAASWTIEEVGVTSGRVFGPYHYTATPRGPRWARSRSWSRWRGSASCSRATRPPTC